MVLSAVFLLDLKGKVLISRNYRGDVPMSMIDTFPALVVHPDEERVSTLPVVYSPKYGAHFVYVRHANIYVVGLAGRNLHASMALLFLQQLVTVFTEYFQSLEEESIRDNFVLIYELLDEMMDYGYPQITETKVLQEFITQESYRMDVVKPPAAATGAVSWRTEGIRYRKNEVFLDVIENVSLLVNSKGAVLSSDVLGGIKMKCFLSGMPELRLGLNDKALFESARQQDGRNAPATPTTKRTVEMDDIRFHQCVRLARFESDRTISFVPPDGEFELLSYRLAAPSKPLVWVEASMETRSGSKVEVVVKLKTQYKRRSTANWIDVTVPVPNDADTPRFNPSFGTASYVPEEGGFVWRLKQVPGGKEAVLRAVFGLPTVIGEEQDWKTPIKVKFEIPYFTVSGLQVRYLKVVEKSGYQSFPWVRYITQAGDYEFRLPEITSTSAADRHDGFH